MPGVTGAGRVTFAVALPLTGTFAATVAVLPDAFVGVVVFVLLLAADTATPLAARRSSDPVRGTAQRRSKLWQAELGRNTSLDLTARELAAQVTPALPTPRIRGRESFASS